MAFYEERHPILEIKCCYSKGQSKRESANFLIYLVLNFSKISQITDILRNFCVLASFCRENSLKVLKAPFYISFCFLDIILIKDLANF